MKRNKKYFKLVLLFSFLFLVTGCFNSNSSSGSGSSASEASTEEAQENTDESESKQNIRAALETVFNGPNEKLTKAYEGMSDNGFKSEELKKHLSHFPEYFKEHYKPYVSEGFYEASFINTPDASYFLEAAHPDYKLKTEGITIEEKEGYYKFAMEVSYTNNQSGESETVEVRGHAQTNEEEKVSSINYINVEDLYQELR
ncbi:hypothetical protein [Halobacillus alkaliphilus]|nr:hypothetical protein [Halobacillus alkaliphilus]